LLNTSQARYSILLFNIWLTISTLLLNVKYWSSVFANTFTASFWPGYTQEVCFFFALEPV